MTITQTHRLGQSSRMCSDCCRELPATVRYFPLAAGKPSGLGLTCKECRDIDKNEGRPRRGTGCYQCENMSWRRPADGTACKCGEFYAEEKAPPLEYGSAFRNDRTTYPETAGHE